MTDTDARKHFVGRYIGLVWSIACEFNSADMPIEDRVQEGVIGLMKAYDKYDPERAEFTTYAPWWVRQAIRRAIHQDRLVHVPEHALTDRNIVHAYREKVALRTGQRPTIEEAVEVVRGRLQECDKTAVEVCGLIFINASMDDEFGDEDTRTMHDTMGDEFEDPAESHRMDTRAASRAFWRLSARSRQILRWRFGIGGVQRMTLQEIGDTLGMSRERVRQLQNVALGQMRRALGIERKTNGKEKNSSGRTGRKGKEGEKRADA